MPAVKLWIELEHEGNVYENKIQGKRIYLQH